MLLRSRISANFALVLSLALVTLFLAGSALAEPAIAIDLKSGKEISISSARATLAADGWHVEGKLQRRRFGSRRPLQGLVMVAVHDAAGVVVRQQKMQASGLFVPKGIRGASFRGVLEGAIPPGGTMSMTSLN